MSKVFFAWPHRKMINQSLRKEAEKLYTIIDDYQKRYDAQNEKNTKELENYKNQLDSEFERVKTAILDKLSSEEEILQAISNIITDYAATYFERQLARKKIEIYEIQMGIIYEYLGFLSDQINETNIEINMLRERKEMLSREADVEDIIRLIHLSGDSFPIEGIINAKDLLKRVTDLENAAKRNLSNERITLSRIRAIIEERVSFLDEIQYISWVIDQKIKLNRELSYCHKEQIRLQSLLNKEADNVQKEIKRLSSVLLNMAREIRFFWAKKIVFVDADLYNCYVDIEIVQINQKSLKNDIYVDRYKKERLNREWVELSNTIDSLKSQKSNLINKRKSFLDFTWSNNVPIIKISSGEQSDEDIYVETRMPELILIESEGKCEALQVYQAELDRLNAEKEDTLRKKISLFLIPKKDLIVLLIINKKQWKTSLMRTKSH